MDFAFQLNGYHPSCFQSRAVEVRGLEEDFERGHPIEDQAGRLLYRQADTLVGAHPAEVVRLLDWVAHLSAGL